MSSQLLFAEEIGGTGAPIESCIHLKLECAFVCCVCAMRSKNKTHNRCAVSKNICVDEHHLRGTSAYVGGDLHQAKETAQHVMTTTNKPCAPDFA